MCFVGLPLQKLMVTHHTKLNLDTTPCQEEQDYHFQAFFMLIISISIIVIITSRISIKNYSLTSFLQACVKKSLAKRLKVMMINLVMVMMLIRS